MRLLQLNTGPGELIDLHPLVTVVTGLDAPARASLTDAVIGLASGTTNGQSGLLEAHGVLFDLSPEMLSLLEVPANDARPVVRGTDLPIAFHQQSRSAIEELWARATEEDGRAQANLLAAEEAVDRAGKALEAASADDAGRRRSLDDATAELARARERRRRLAEAVSALSLERGNSSVGRIAVELSTADVRARHQEALDRVADVSARLDQARLRCDPHPVVPPPPAVVAEGLPNGSEPQAERLARLEEEIEGIEKRLAAFGDTQDERVSVAVSRLRSHRSGALVPLAGAIDLADELEALETALAGTEAGGGAQGGGLAEAKVRLDDARHALHEAELALRPPAPDREAVDRLEQAHAELLDAVDKSDSRFGGARAQRQLEAAREAEAAVLDELGFASYAGYVMGSPLVSEDLAKEAALDAAREELAGAEDAWRSLQDLTEAELAREERVERRRLLFERAQALLGRPVDPASVVEELRRGIVEAPVPAEVVDDLREALEDAGVLLSDDVIDVDDLLLVANAWTSEAASALGREADLRSELGRLRGERVEVVAALGANPTPLDQPARSSAPQVRTQGAAQARDGAHAPQDRRGSHLEAERAVDALAEVLAAAEELEQIEASAAFEGEAALAAAVRREEDALAAYESAERELAGAVQVEEELKQRLGAHTASEAATTEELAAALDAARALQAEAKAQAERTASSLREASDQRAHAAAGVTSMPEAADTTASSTDAEQVEWYLLTRLAAQRSLSLAGSVPLLLDDALSGLDEALLGQVLDRLEEMAGAVQVIVVTEDPAAASWALLAGANRAAVVRPQPVGTA